jgi:hypothetical protein
MKLISRVDALQRRADAAVDSARGPDLDEFGRVGMVWTTEEVVVDPSQVSPGEHVAVDLIVGREASEHVFPARYRTRERFSSVPGDLGLVYDSSGSRIGRVLSAPRGYVRWARDDAASG